MIGLISIIGGAKPKRLCIDNRQIFKGFYNTRQFRNMDRGIMAQRFRFITAGITVSPGILYYVLSTWSSNHNLNNR